MVELKRVLGFPAILLITINSIMGTGIYFLPAAGAKHAGPASLISWAIMSIIALYVGMCFAELCAMFPKAGGVYEYAKQAYGRFPSFLVGWVTLISGNITIAMLIVGGIQYLLPYNLPLIKMAISLFFIFAFNFIAYKGMKVSAVMLITFSLLTLGVVISLIIPGLFKVQLSNLNPFFVFPMSSILVTLYFIQETFFGWESATFLAEETKDPEKVMPKALIWGTVAISVMAILLVFVSLGVVPWQQFAESAAPLATLGFAEFGAIGKDIFTLWVYIAIIGAVACWVVSAPRLVLALARDKLFLSQFAKIHPVYNTPYKSIMLQVAITSLLIIIGSGAYRTLLLMLIPMVVLMYAAVLLGLVILRYKKPHIHRPFKVPFGKVGPIVIILIFISFLGIWLSEEAGAIHILSLAGSLVLIGVPLYFLLEMYYNPKVIRIVDDILANFVLLTERISLPLALRKQIIELLGPIKGKSVLEFGCSVGTLTMHLAEEVGPEGMVYATDISEHESNIARKRMETKGHKHVKIIHDIHHERRIHPDVPKVHTAVSVGMLGYVQEVRSVLRDINSRLVKGAKLCFVDYDKFFDVIPNIEWLSDDTKIKRIFRDSGFHVDVFRKQGLAWKYIFIYGVKFKNV